MPVPGLDWRVRRCGGVEYLRRADEKAKQAAPRVFPGLSGAGTSQLVTDGCASFNAAGAAVGSAGQWRPLCVVVPSANRQAPSGGTGGNQSAGEDPFLPPKRAAQASDVVDPSFGSRDSSCRLWVGQRSLATHCCCARLATSVTAMDASETLAP